MNLPFDESSPTKILSPHSPDIAFPLLRPGGRLKGGELGEGMEEWNGFGKRRMARRELIWDSSSSAIVSG